MQDGDDDDVDGDDDDDEDGEGNVSFSWSARIFEGHVACAIDLICELGLSSLQCSMFGKSSN